MSHLVCVQHKSRVLVLPEKVIHRSDGSRCTSAKVTIGGRTYWPNQVRTGKQLLQVKDRSKGKANFTD